MNLILLLKAYKVIHNEEVKQKQFDRLQATPINYGIIRDLINSASQGVDIQVTFPDGTKLDIKRAKDAFEKAEKQMSEAF